MMSRAQKIIETDNWTDEDAVFHGILAPERPEALWLRFGIGDDYHACEDIDEVADELHAYGVYGIRGWITGYEIKNDYSWNAENAVGLTTDSYPSSNYVSLFWGFKDEPGFVRGISPQERGELEGLL